MPQAITTTYLQVESVGADKLIATMSGLQKSMNFVAGMLKDLNKGLGISSRKAKEGAEAINEQAKAASDAAAQATQLRVAMAAQMATTADLAKTVKGLSEEQKKQSKSLDWQAISSKVQLAKQAYNAVKNALSQVGQEALRVAQAWEVQEAAEMRLNAALQQNPAKGQIENYKQWASELQNSTRFGDEFILNLASQAARMSKNEKQTKRMTEAALNWASATGGDANNALQTIMRATNGSSEALQRLGIQLTQNEKERLKEASQAEKTAFVLKKLEAQYAGFAEAMATTPTGALEQAKNTLGDIDEQVGRLVSPALYAGLGVVNEYLQGQINDILAITDNAEALDNLQRDILGLLQATGRTLIDIKTAIGIVANAATILGGALFTAWTAPLKPVGMLMDFFAGLPGLGQGARRALQGIADTLSAPFDLSVQSIKDDYKDMKALYAQGEKEKEAFEISTYKSFERYQAMAKKRQEAAGLGDKSRGGGGGGLGMTKKEREAEVEAQKTQLSEMEAAQFAYEQKLFDTRQLFAKKRQSLEASLEIDEESKSAYKIQLTEQEEEAIRQVRLQYAQETDDQLTLLEDQYRQEKLAKEAAAQEEIKAQQKATMEALASNLKSVTGLGVDMLTSWIEGTGDWRAQLYDAMKSFSVNLMKTSLASIIDQALVNQAKAQGSQAAIPFVGPALALVAGAAMFATTMALKNKLKPAEVQYAKGGYISAGMVTGGAFGRDSVAALLEPGERVLSKKEAAAYDNAAGRAGQTVNINLSISGQLSTPEQVRDTVRRVLLPELNAALKGGYRLAV